MGKHFGNLQRLYGVTYYVLSPTELNPFTGMINPGLKNAFRRIIEHGLPFGIVGGLTYLLYYQVEEYNYKLNRKNPELYKDDV